MKVYRIEEPGSLQGLVLREEPTRKPGPGQVLVRIRATTLNYRDTFVLNGWIPGVKKDVVPLTDAAGEIVAIGPGVRRFNVGDRVLNYFFLNWIGGPHNFMPEQYTVEHDGWLAEYKVVDAEALVAIPENLSFEEAATFVCAGTTAWSALKGVVPGETVLTLGTGGVSLFAIQFAKAMGARVISTTSRPDNSSRLIDLGASHVIDYVTDPSWGETAKALTDGRGVDRVVEVGGASTMAQSVNAVARGGQVSMVGILGGAEGGVDFLSMFLSQARYQPIPTGSRSDLEAALRAVKSHDIHPVIDRLFALSEAPAAFAHFADGRPFGKVVIQH